MTQEKLGQALRFDVSAGAEIRKRYQPHRGQPPATHCFDSASPNLLLLRRCSRTIIYPRRALRLRLRLPRHVGRARADESLHADRKRKLRRSIVALVKQMAGEDEHEQVTVPII